MVSLIFEGSPGQSAVVGETSPEFLPNVEILFLKVPASSAEVLPCVLDAAHVIASPVAAGRVCSAGEDAGGIVAERFCSDKIAEGVDIVPDVAPLEQPSLPSMPDVVADVDSTDILAKPDRPLIESIVAEPVVHVDKVAEGVAESSCLAALGHSSMVDEVPHCVSECLSRGLSAVAYAGCRRRGPDLVLDYDTEVDLFYNCADAGCSSCQGLLSFLRAMSDRLDVLGCPGCGDSCRAEFTFMLCMKIENSFAGAPPDLLAYIADHMAELVSKSLPTLVTKCRQARNRDVNMRMNEDCLVLLAGAFVELCRGLRQFSR
jgi:hypothetical protein